jgi:hypothetical protein
MREIPGPAGYKAGDVFVLFGELFGRGYANGIVEEARRDGMKILGITVGRRDAGGMLRPLTAEELADAEANLGGRIINIPLEAGFDMEPGSSGVSPVERLKGVKTDEWDKVSLDWDAIEQSRLAGTLPKTWLPLSPNSMPLFRQGRMSSLPIPWQAGFRGPGFTCRF